MAGRIRDEDVATVRDRSAIVDVISEYVPLRNAGGGSMKGLCPFHEEKSPSFNVNPARGFYHCLAGETRVLTWDGVRPISELAGSVHRVLKADGSWTDAPFRSYGVQPLLRVELSRDGQHKTVHATAQHRWFERTGPGSSRRREVLTEDLRPGMRLAHAFPSNRTRRTHPSPFGIAHGIVYGDGRLGRDGAIGRLDPVKDVSLLKWFPLSRTSEDADRILLLDMPNSFMTLPSLEESTSYLLGFLAGYLAADGHVAEDGTVMLSCASRATLEHVRMLCTRLGIGTYGSTEQVREVFPGREPSPIFRIHLLNDDLSEDVILLEEHRLRFSGARKDVSRRGWTVRSVGQTDRVEEVFCAEVEDGHAFTLEDNLLTGNCFGCGVGGDVIAFVMAIDSLPFVEAVERLADKAHIQLRYENAGSAPVRPTGQRSRLVAANAAAQEFYAEQLVSPDALAARTYLSERGFDADVAQGYGCGYAPRTWDALTKHLRSKGFTDKELIAAGLGREGQRGMIDRFLGRLLWPIRDISGDVVGFGARRIHDDDRIEAKYVNTPETVLYKKSQLLYGVDMAKKEIARRHQAVIVEGYTDVMSCHLSGVPTAVATCGTAFGGDHIKVLRRLLMDSDEFRGEVIFTFDGDAAGQKAALRAFDDDQRFVTQTFVAIEPSGMDPCELRLDKGDAAVRDLVARRQPLFEFAVRTTIERHNLDTTEGRLAALDAAAPIVARIRDVGLRQRYAVNLDRWLGLMDEKFVLQRVREHAAGKAARATRTAEAGATVPEQTGPTRPDPADRTLHVQRAVLKIALQVPQLAGPLFDALDETMWTDPTYVLLRQAIAKAGGAASATDGPGWPTRVAEACAGDTLRSLVAELAVEPMPTTVVDARYVGENLARLQEQAVGRQLAALKSRLQRLNPVEHPDDYAAMFGELVALEQYRRGLREQGIGEL